MIDGESIRWLEGTESQPDNEVNIGPLPQEIVDEEVQFAYERGTFGLCLDPQYIDEDYLRDMAGRLDLSSIEIEPSDLLTDADIPEMVDSGDILLADHFLSNPEDGLHIDVPDNRYLAKIGSPTGEEWSCLGVVEGETIQNEIPVPVEVTKVHPTYIETKGALPEREGELTNSGKTVTATTGPQTENGTLAIYETDYAIPILLKDTQYPSGEALELQINAVKGTYAIGEAVFSANDFDIIHIDDNKLPYRDRQSRNRVIRQGVPIDIEPVLEGAPTTSRVIVTGEGTDALVGRWDIQKETASVDITEGDEIELDIRSVDGDSCVGYYKQFPVRVNFHTAVPAEFESERLSVSIQTVHPDKAIAEPKWITEAQGALNVRIVGSIANNTIATREGHLVQIPNSSVVSSGDQIIVGLSESMGNDATTATVSARPVFRETDAPHLVRLPRIRGDVVEVDGTLAVVDHLPDVDTSVTLGVAEMNEDHIVPTVTALPEAYLPDEGTYITAEPKGIVDNMVVGVGEELPLRLPSFLPTQDDTITARVLERRNESLFGVIGSERDDTDDHLLQVYEHLQLADLTLQQRKYREAAQQLSEALQSCPSELPVFERLLAVHEMMIQAILAIHDSAEFGQTTNMLSQEANRLREFENDGCSTAEVAAFLSAREAEMRAAERLLTALDEVDDNTTSNLQAIAQGVSAKAPAVEATEHLSTAKELVARTQFEEQVPSFEVRAVIREFEEAFPGIVDELRPFDPPEDNADWFRYLLPEWIIERTDESLHHTKTSGDTWQRPAVPETMGIVSMTDIAGDDAAKKYPTAAQNTSKPEEGLRPKESNGSNTDTTESRQTEVDGLQDSTTDEESPASEPEQTPTVIEGNIPEQVATTEASSNESGAADGKTSTTEDTAEEKTETTPGVKTASSTTESETAESETLDEQLSVPDDSPKLRELRKKAEAEASENPEREHVETTASRYRRSSAVQEYALERADGTCELCGEVAPFVKPDGDPFLEVHHVDELGEGGADHPSLVGAVCPNCHREIHHGKRGDDLNEQLRQRLEKGLGDVGAVDE